MDRTRFLSFSILSVFLITIIVIGVFLHYPLNLIIDGIALAVVGIAALVYIVIWSFLGDRIVVHDDHIKVMTRRFPIWSFKERVIYFHEVSHYIVNGSDMILLTKKEDIFHIYKPESEEGMRIRDLPVIMEKKGIRRMAHKDFIKKKSGKKGSYMTRI